VQLPARAITSERSAVGAPRAKKRGGVVMIVRLHYAGRQDGGPFALRRPYTSGLHRRIDVPKSDSRSQCAARDALPCGDAGRDAALTRSNW